MTWATASRTPRRIARRNKRGLSAVSCGMSRGLGVLTRRRADPFVEIRDGGGRGSCARRCLRGGHRRSLSSLDPFEDDRGQNNSGSRRRVREAFAVPNAS